MFAHRFFAVGGFAPRYFPPVPATGGFNPAWIQQFNVIIDGRVTVVPA